MKASIRRLVSSATPQKEAQEYISSSDCPEYLRKAEARLGEEVERCGAYLNADSTEPKITRVVEAELLKAQVGGRARGWEPERGRRGGGARPGAAWWA
jgi:hypothetical protein